MPGDVSDCTLYGHVWTRQGVASDVWIATQKASGGRVREDAVSETRIIWGPVHCSRCDTLAPEDITFDVEPTPPPPPLTPSGPQTIEKGIKPCR